MKTLSDYKIRHSDVLREIEANFRKQKENQTAYEEKARAAQIMAEDARRALDAANRPLQQKMGELEREKTELDGVLKHLEEAAQPPKEG